jgi:N-acetylmuramoyl-L-alanine amidase
MKQIQMVAISAGHGRNNLAPLIKDPGATTKVRDAIRGTYVLTEHELAKELAIMVVDILKVKPELAKAIVTGVGTSEKGASINQKVKYVKEVITQNKLDPKKVLGVAIHFNAGGGKGIECFYQTPNPEGKTVADYLTKSVQLYTKFGPHTTYVKPDTQYSAKRLYIRNYFVNGSYTNFVLLEVCYLDNTTELSWYLQNKGRVAEGIANGILSYIRA